VHHAALKASIEILKLVLDAGGEPAEQGLYGRTPLECAAVAGHKPDSEFFKTLEAAIEDAKARKTAMWQTGAAFLAFMIAYEWNTSGLSEAYVWLACSKFGVAQTGIEAVSGRGGTGFSDAHLDALAEEECDLGIFGAKMIAILSTLWMIFVLGFWYRNQDIMKWKAF